MKLKQIVSLRLKFSKLLHLLFLKNKPVKQDLCPSRQRLRHFLRSLNIIKISVNINDK